MYILMSQSGKFVTEQDTLGTKAQARQFHRYVDVFNYARDYYARTGVFVTTIEKK